MTISRALDPAGPSVMTLHFTDRQSAKSIPPAINSTADTVTSSEPPKKSTAEPPTTGTKTVEMMGKDESQILGELMRQTHATKVEPSSRDLRHLREIQEHKEQAAKDRSMVEEALARVKAKKEAYQEALAMED